MKKSFILVTVVALLVMLTSGCAPEGGQAPILPAPEQGAPSPTDEPTSTPTTTPTPAGEEVNFRLLISDEVNAIDDFDELWVTITQIGVQQGGESGAWIERDLDPGEKVDLTELKGDNATEIWSGELDNGTYTKVFIHVSIVEGVLAGGEVNVKLPSGKLQISKPFEVTSGEVTEFVYDITVIKAGESGKYILKPQIAQSGPDKDFNDVTVKGKPEDTGKPEGQEAEEDATPPVISISGVANDKQYTAPVTPTFEVSDETDPEPTVTATLNDNTFVSGTEVSEVGEYELVVTAVDASGNEAESSVNFEIVEVGDTTAPVIDVSGVSDGEQYTEPVTPIVDVSDETDPNPTVTITLNGVEFASETEISEVGEYELEITATDASGNEAEVTISFGIVQGE